MCQPVSNKGKCGLFVRLGFLVGLTEKQHQSRVVCSENKVYTMAVLTSDNKYVSLDVLSKYLFFPLASNADPDQDLFEDGLCVICE